jgi:hypothetical protein
MHRRTLSSALGSAAFVLVCASTVPAFSQSDEQRAGARSLATEGATAFRDGRYKDAVDLFSKAESLVHAPPHLLFMARAQTKLGQLVKAREAYLKITREQLAPSAPQAFRDAQTSSSREMAAIDPKIGGLTVKIEGSDAAKDLQVKVDGTPVPAVLVGASLPIDPGEHRVDAVATGYRAQSRSLMVGEGEKASVTLRLEADPAAVPVGVAAAAPTAPETAAAGNASAGGQLATGGQGPVGSPPPADTGTGGSGSHIGAYSAFGIGAIGIGLGAVFLVKSGSERAKADDICNLPNNQCPIARKAEVDEADNAANSARTVGVVGLVVGGLAVGTGVALLVLGKGGSGSEMKSATIQPWLGIGSAGVSGRF